MELQRLIARNRGENKDVAILPCAGKTLVNFWGREGDERL
jgi:hypothetical protein